MLCANLLEHDCLGWRFTNGPLHAWELERDGETIRIDPKGPLVAGFGGATDFLVEAAVAGCGIVYLFEDWLRPFIDRGELGARASSRRRSRCGRELVEAPDVLMPREAFTRRPS